MLHPSRTFPKSSIEFLEARIAPATFLVTTTDDSGAGSLRQAILDANAQEGADTIRFYVPGAAVFKPASALPQILDAVTILGDTDPAPGSAPRYILSGANAGNASGLWFTGPATAGSKLRGLTISEFNGNGITISDTHDLEIVNCHVGKWSDYIGNAGAGIQILGSNEISIGRAGALSSLTTPGGKAWGFSNVIVGNTLAGIQLIGGGGHEIYGNLIGLTASGTASANSEGILIQSAIVTIGAAGPGDGNVISGNKSRGIYVMTSVGTVIQGNHVGTDLAGTKAVPNGNIGIWISGPCRDTIIGGTQPGEGNLISGNGANGISFSGPNTGVPSDSGQTKIQGNLIGTDSTGTRPLPNKTNGISITLRSSVLIGGADAGAMNVISGNGGDGIRLLQSEFIAIQQNFIGTDPTGTRYCGNSYDGISIYGGKQIQIGGSLLEQRNIISGNRDYGISVGGEIDFEYITVTVETTIQNNYIGTNSRGNSAISNMQGGISLGVRSEGIQVNGGNVISANNGPGIVVKGAKHIIHENLIGLNAAGIAILGNSGNGIELYSRGTIVRSNVISGNGVALSEGGIFVAGENHLIESNRIGFDLTGTIALGNGNFGIAVTGNFGTAATSKSVISHNQITGAAVPPNSGFATGISITGGTHLVSDNSIINCGVGINVTGGANHQVVRNTILDAKVAGIDFYNRGNGATISDNYIRGGGIEYFGYKGIISGNVIERPVIGIAITGLNVEVIGNIINHSTSTGIEVAGLIEGLIAGNTIADSGGTGLHILRNRISGYSPTGVVRDNHIHGGSGAGIVMTRGSIEFSHNLIYNNTGIAIDLGWDGITPNYPGDADIGPNGFQNTIIFQRAVLGNRHLIIDGSFDGAANRALRVEYFAILLDEAGAEIGAQFLAESVIETDEIGHANIRESLPPTSAHSRIVATVTDLTDRVTSEVALTDLIVAPSVMAVGTGAGTKGVAKLIRASALDEVIVELKPYGEKFRGGIRVAHADIDGDGFEDLITAPDSHGRIVQIFSGFDGSMLAEWEGAPRGYRGGISVAAGDVDGDGTAEVVTALGYGRGPTVTVRDAMTGTVESSFLAFNKIYRSGLNLSVGDLDNDGDDDIVASLRSGVALVKAFTGTGESLSPLIRPFAGQASIGAFTAIIPAAADSQAQIAVGSGVGARGAVQFFDVSGSRLSQLTVFDGRRFAGLRLASADVDGDGVAEVIATLGPGHRSNAEVIPSGSAPDGPLFDPSLRTGVFVG